MWAAVCSWPLSLALFYLLRQYSKAYDGLEDEARGRHIGIWQGGFETPSEWRKRTKGSTTQGSVLPVAAVPPAVQPSVKQQQGGGGTSCADGAPALIKGNISAKGDKIYHTPGSGTYDQVR